MFNSVWSAALSVALGAGPAQYPAPQPVSVAQAPQRTMQQVAPAHRRPQPPRLLQPQAAAPIAPQLYRPAPAPQWQYAAPQPVQYYYVSPQYHGVIPASAEIPVMPVEAPLPTPVPVPVAEPTLVPEPAEGGINGYLHEISSYVGPSGFRTYNYTQVSSDEEAIGDEDVTAAGVADSCENEEALRQHLTKIGATAYAAELARLRARQDFEQLNKLAAPIPTPTATTAAIQIVPPPAPTPLPADQLQVQTTIPQIAPANYHPEQPRVDQMKQQLEQQSLRLNALQKAVEKQNANAPAPRPAEAPKPKRKGLIYQLFD